jgi:hypothetical protein
MGLGVSTAQGSGPSTDQSSLKDAGPTAAGRDAGGFQPDAGAPDAGIPDAGIPDAGTRSRTIGVPPAGRLYHGVFPAGSGLPETDISMVTLQGYQTAVGRPLAWVYFSHEWYLGKAFPRVTAEAIRDRGAVPFVRLHMRSQQVELVTDPTYTLDRIIAGDFDADLRAWADGAKTFGTPLIVQYGTEINGDWYPWSAPYNGGWTVGPAKFKAAFRHIVEVMRAEGADNITWALHYNGENWPGDNPLNVPQSYYPGDDVVDWIGLSIYGNYGPGDGLCRSFASLLQQREQEIAQVTTEKPLFIFEVGISSGASFCDPTAWVGAVLNGLLGGRWPELRGFAWWDESDMLVQGNPILETPFHEVLNGPNAGVLLDRPLLP